MLLKRKAKRKEIVPSAKSCQNGFGYEIPPDLLTVHIYFEQKGLAAEANNFWEQYEAVDWKSRKGTPFRNWKVLAADWIFDYQQALKLRERLEINQQQPSSASINNLNT